MKGEALRVTSSFGVAAFGPGAETPEGLVSAADSESVKEEYVANTQEALNVGVFGVPSYVYKGELFWGQDRLDFLERALKKG